MIKKVVSFLVAINFFIAVSAQNIALVINQKSSYTIVIPADATEVEKQSAAVLNNYLKKIANCTLPIVTQVASSNNHQVIIGRNKFVTENDIKQLGADGFIIKKINNSLLLFGGNRKGTLYSVYHLIEVFFGCRMYTADAVFIPQKRSISLPAINIRQKPDFDYRKTFFIDAFNQDYCDFHKINYFWQDWGLWVHSFDVLVSKAKYFESHPEYFALVNGQRTADQLCLTNPAVLNIVIENLQNLLNQKPNEKFWSVSQNDNDNFCECENCRRLNEEQSSVNGSVLKFVNEVASHFPNKIITTLAYRKTEKPPKTLKPLTNVLVMLCAAYDERRIPLIQQTNVGFYSNFKNWTTLTRKLFLWDYIVPLANALYPFPNFYTIQSNVQYFASRDAEQVFLEGCGDFHGDFSELRCYLSSKVMWNKNVDVKSCMLEFIDGYYGKAGGNFIWRYINLLDKNAALKPVGLRSGGEPSDAINSFLSIENINAYKNIFDSAINATNGTSYNARIYKEYMSVLFAELEINKTMIEKNNRLTNSNKIAIERLLNNFSEKAQELNIVYLNEARTTVNDYYKKYQQFLSDKNIMK